MKIGVAISGCDIGGAAAYAALDEIEKQGYDIAAVSCCSIAAVSSALFSLNTDIEKCEEIMQTFLNKISDKKTETALEEICNKLSNSYEKRNRLIINAADIATGSAVLFTDDFDTQTKNFSTLGIDDYYNALSSAAAPFAGLTPLSFGGYLLCDYSLKYGSPIMVLKYLGIKKILSLNFSALSPQTPYELAQNCMAELNSAKSEFYINVSSQKGGSIADYSSAARQAVNTHITELAEKMLFNIAK